VQKSPGQGTGRGQGGKKKSGGPRQPDPMQTAGGFIGADAFTRKSGGRGRPGGSRGKPPGRGGGQGGRGR
jgi:23S rRNA pseudouridine2605 synthase